MGVILGKGFSYLKLIFLIVLLLITWLHTGKASASPYKYEGQWGSVGAGNGQFDGAAGVALDPSGNIYMWQICTIAASRSSIQTASI
jgi:hypothetical protein